MYWDEAQTSVPHARTFDHSDVEATGIASPEGGVLDGGAVGVSLELRGRGGEHSDVHASLGLGKFVGAELSLTIIEASHLIGKDGRLFRKATSDPFVKVLIAGEEIAKTEYVSDNLSPKWNAKVLTGYKIGPTFGENSEIRLCIFDYDIVTAGDPMGEVHRHCDIINHCCDVTRLRAVDRNDWEGAT